jgi:hypothetical protein
VARVAVEQQAHLLMMAEEVRPPVILIEARVWIAIAKFSRVYQR